MKRRIALKIFSRKYSGLPPFTYCHLQVKQAVRAVYYGCEAFENSLEYENFYTIVANQPGPLNQDNMVSLMWRAKVATDIRVEFKSLHVVLA